MKEIKIHGTPEQWGHPASHRGREVGSVCTLVVPPEWYRAINKEARHTEDWPRKMTEEEKREILLSDPDERRFFEM